MEQIFNYTKQPVYLYELDYKASNSFSQIFGDPEGDYGTSALWAFLNITYEFNNLETHKNMFTKTNVYLRQAAYFEYQ